MTDFNICVPLSTVNGLVERVDALADRLDRLESSPVLVDLSDFDRRLDVLHTTLGKVATREADDIRILNRDVHDIAFDLSRLQKRLENGEI